MSSVQIVSLTLSIIGALSSVISFSFLGLALVDRYRKYRLNTPTRFQIQMLQNFYADTNDVNIKKNELDFIKFDIDLEDPSQMAYKENLRILQFLGFIELKLGTSNTNKLEAKSKQTCYVRVTVKGIQFLAMRRKRISRSKQIKKAPELLFSVVTIHFKPKTIKVDDNPESKTIKHKRKTRTTKNKQKKVSDTPKL